jgi:hypothetical protein
LYNKLVPVFQHNHNQPSVRAFAVVHSKLPLQAPHRKQKEVAKKVLDKLQLQLSSATKNAENPIQLEDLVSLKRKKKNEMTIHIGAISPAKLRELIMEGFMTTKQFLAIWRLDRSDSRIVALLNNEMSVIKESKW